MRLLTAIFGEEQREVNFSFPQRPSELTWGQAMDLVSIKDDSPERMLELVSYLTEIPVDEWRDSEDTEAFINLAIDAQSFLNEWGKELGKPKTPRAGTVVIEGSEVTLPDEIGQKTVGQYQDVLHLQNKWAEESKDNDDYPISGTFSFYANIFRIYVQPLLDGKYDYTKAMALDIRDVPYPDVIDWAYFFLTSQQKLKNGIRTNVKQHRTQVRKRKRGFRLLRRNTNS